MSQTPPSAGTLTLRGGRVLRAGRWVETDLHVADGRVVEAPGPSGAGGPVLDVTGLLVAPGLIDLQCNGAAGIDLRAEPERLWELSSVLPRWGVTAWLPTIVTSTPDVVERALDTFADGPPPGWRGATPLGLHLEGPFLAPAAAGAHPVELLRPPSLAEAGRWTRAAGVAMVTMAPELEGALEVVERLAAGGVCVSVGHSHATVAEVERAIDAGARSVTHLFNAMSALHHRAPGVPGAALTDPRLSVGLIADGIHVDPLVVGLAQRAMGERLVLVSDAVALLGTPGVDPRAGVRLADGTLAGSVLPLVDAVANLVSFSGCTAETALHAASARPADVLGDPGRGRLDPGSRADLVVLDPDLHLEYTVIAGEILSPNGGGLRG